MSRRRARRELDEASRELDAAFPPPPDDAADAAWEVYGAVDEALAAVAGGARRSGFAAKGSAAFDAALRELRPAREELDDGQRRAVERLARAVRTMESLGGG